MAKAKKVGGGKCSAGARSQFMPTRVSNLDKAIDKRGLERGSAILLSGDTGTGKSLFALQSAYNAALKGEKVAYFSLEEEPQDIKRRVLNSFGWDLGALEKKGVLAIQKVSPNDMARSIEGRLKERGIEQVIEGLEKVRLEAREITMPFRPDMVVIDPVSALMPSFSDHAKYRTYLGILFDSLRNYGSVNLMISEAKPEAYSRAGVEEYLADGVISFHSVKKNGGRAHALEIVKLRFSGHTKKLIPFDIGKKGIRISLR